MTWIRRTQCTIGFSRRSATRSRSPGAEDIITALRGPLGVCGRLQRDGRLVTEGGTGRSDSGRRAGTGREGPDHRLGHGRIACRARRSSVHRGQQWRLRVVFHGLRRAKRQTTCARRSSRRRAGPCGRTTPTALCSGSFQAFRLKAKFAWEDDCGKSGGCTRESLHPRSIPALSVYEHGPIAR